VRSKAAAALNDQLADDVGAFFFDPLGFVMYAYPWGERGPLEAHDGPDRWQRECLEHVGRQTREHNFDGVRPVLPIRIAVPSGHGTGKGALGVSAGLDRGSTLSS
jgi:hypothetical protein